jgi:hypothetical protein
LEFNPQQPIIILLSALWESPSGKKESKKEKQAVNSSLDCYVASTQLYSILSLYQASYKVRNGMKKTKTKANSSQLELLLEFDQSFCQTLTSRQKIAIFEEMM